MLLPRLGGRLVGAGHNNNSREGAMIIVYLEGFLCDCEWAGWGSPGD